MRPALVLPLLAVLAWAAPLLAQEEILGPDAASRTFVVTLSGAAGSKSFNGVRAQLTVNAGAQERNNPLLLVITGFPELGGRNSLFWNSEMTSMEVLAGRVRCRLKPGTPQGTLLHFYYMSPALFKSKGKATHREDERLRWVETHAKPLKVLALEGDLDLTVQGNRVTGTVWMTGMDPRGHDPVRYHASFTGVETVRERPKP